MNSIARWTLAIVVSLILVGYPHESDANGFDGKEFLTWSTTAQDSYFQTSITMAAIMATKTRRASGDCLGAWYLSPQADRAKRHETLRAAISRNDGHHPSAVIFLVLQDACGPFADPVN